MTPTRWNAALVLLTSAILGCDTPDARLVRQAEMASERQAEQNRQIAHQNQQLAEATNRLVDADASARRETVQLQRELQDQQAKVGVERDRLESERRTLARQRQRDPLIATALGQLGLVVACIAPLTLAAWVVWVLRSEPPDVALGDLVVTELASSSPLLLPSLNSQLQLPNSANGADGPVQSFDDSSDYQPSCCSDGSSMT